MNPNAKTNAKANAKTNAFGRARRVRRSGSSRASLRSVPSERLRPLPIPHAEAPTGWCIYRKGDSGEPPFRCMILKPLEGFGVIR